MSKFSRRWFDDQEWARVRILATYQFDGDVLAALRYAKGVDST